MPVVSTASNHAAQTKALIEERRRLPLRPLVGLFLPHEELDLLGKKAADGSSTARSQDFSFPHGLPAEAYRHVLLGIPRSCHGFILPRVLRATRVLRVLKCLRRVPDRKPRS